MVWVSPDTSVCAVTCNICQDNVCLFFRRHGDSRVRRISDIHQSYIYSKTTISSWSAYCKHLSESWMKLDSVSSTSVSSLGYASIKGENGISIQTFLICVIKLRLPPDCMWPGLDPNKEVHESVGASLYLFLRYLKHAYWEYIYILIYKHNYSLVLFFQHIFTNISIKVLQCSSIKITGRRSQFWH